MIFVDLDGVLGDFDGWAKSVMAPGQTYLSLFMTEYERCFANLRVIPRGANLLRALDNPVILTALPNHDEFVWWCRSNGLPASEAERRYGVLSGNKVEWVHRNLGDYPVITVPQRKDKVKFAKGNILIDDYELNVRDWQQAGGIGILFR